LIGTAAFAWAGASPFAKRAIRTGPQPPVTPRIPKRIEQLGRVRIDDYSWLKPSNWKEVWRNSAVLDPKILAYLEEENRYCDAVLEPTRQLQAQLLAEMK